MRHSGRPEGAIRNPIWFLTVKNQIGFRINFLSPAAKRKFCGMTHVRYEKTLESVMWKLASPLGRSGTVLSIGAFSASFKETGLNRSRLGGLYIYNNALNNIDNFIFFLATIC
jgi:hypothetical protein